MASTLRSGSLIRTAKSTTLVFFVEQQEVRHRSFFVRMVITVMRTVDNGNGGKGERRFNVEVPAEGTEFPQARSKYGVSEAEVAKATQACFAEQDPSKSLSG